MAPNGQAVLIWRRPLIGFDRKCLAHHQNGAIDPKRTSNLTDI